MRARKARPNLAGMAGFVIAFVLLVGMLVQAGTSVAYAAGDERSANSESAVHDSSSAAEETPQAQRQGASEVLLSDAAKGDWSVTLSYNPPKAGDVAVFRASVSKYRGDPSKLVYTWQVKEGGGSWHTPEALEGEHGPELSIPTDPITEEDLEEASRNAASGPRFHVRALVTTKSDADKKNCEPAGGWPNTSNSQPFTVRMPDWETEVGKPVASKAEDGGEGGRSAGGGEGGGVDGSTSRRESAFEDGDHGTAGSEPANEGADGPIGAAAASTAGERASGHGASAAGTGASGGESGEQGDAYSVVSDGVPATEPEPSPSTEESATEPEGADGQEAQSDAPAATESDVPASERPAAAAAGHNRIIPITLEILEGDSRADGPFAILPGLREEAGLVSERRTEYFEQFATTVPGARWMALGPVDHTDEEVRQLLVGNPFAPLVVPACLGLVAAGGIVKLLSFRRQRGTSGRA